MCRVIQRGRKRVGIAGQTRFVDNERVVRGIGRDFEPVRCRARRNIPCELRENGNIHSPV